MRERERREDQKCDQCGKEFDTRHRLKMHIRKIHNAKLVKCPTCFKQFKSNVLRRHIACVHATTPAKCDDCGKLFKNKHLLKTHRFTQHGQMNIICDVCTMRFNLNSQLRRHMLTHGDEHPFQCEVCGAKFIRRGCLNRHIKNIHGKSSKVVTQTNRNETTRPSRSRTVSNQANPSQKSERRSRYK